MKTKLNSLLIAALVWSGASIHLHAQVVADGQTNTLNNVTVNLVGNVIVGTNGSFTLLNIINGALLTNSGSGLTGHGYIGSNVTANANVVRVTDPGSRWNMQYDLHVGYRGVGNQLIVSNGGAVSTTFGFFGYHSTSSNNVADVVGTNSRWAAGGYLAVGYQGSFNKVLVRDGATVSSSAGLIGFVSGGDNNLAVVIGAGSLWTNSGEFNVGRFGSGNALSVYDGGRLYNTIGYIGHDSTNNQAEVSGAGSLWTNSSEFYVGNGGSGNSLIVNTGATLANSIGYIGWGGGSFNGGNNVATVSGTGALWTNRSDLYVGYNGSANRLLVNSGGTVVNATGYLGYDFSSRSNVAQVSGAGALWTNSSLLYVGYNGRSNQLLVSSGGRVANTAGYVGFNSNSESNRVVVTDPGSLWTNSSELNIGNSSGHNELIVSAGGTVANTSGYLGRNSTSDNNEAQVTGASSLWTNRGVLHVGNSGSGNRLLVSSGGRVASTAGYLGFNSGSDNNSAAVTGANSRWNNSGELQVGSVGNGNQLVVSNGATVANTFGYLGSASSSSSNVAVVTGAGSLWTHSSGFYVGYAGSANQLVVSNGAAVANTVGVLGDNPGSDNNAAAVTGVGSRWTHSLSLSVGNSGSGNQLVISNGAMVANTDGNIGSSSTSSNNVAVVTGTNSIWTNRFNLRVGDSGSGNQLIVSNGAAAASRDGYIGNNSSSSNNLAVVTGTGSRWNNSLSLSVGSSGSGNQLVVSNGATMANTDGFVGLTSTSGNNLAVVTGVGSLWTNSFSLSVGISGSGNRLVISNGSTVGTIFGYLGRNATSSNNVAVVTGTGSHWTTSGALSVGNSGRSNQLVVSNGAIVSADGMYVGFASGSSNNVIRLANGTLTVISSLTVNLNNTLAGSGTINGPVTIASGATLSPGASLGKLVLNSSPFLQGNVVMEISKNGATLTNDHVQVNSSLTYGGSLTVSNLGPTALAAGDSFQLFSATSYASAFAGYNLPALPSGLKWSTPLTNGILAVVLDTEPEINSLTRIGDLLFFDVTGFPGGNWELITATNLNLPVASWATVQSGVFNGSGQATPFHFVNVFEPTRYYRIKVP